MIPIDDSTVEPSETAILTLSNQRQLLRQRTLNSATVTIADNEPIVTVAATDNSAKEGVDNGVFTMTRTTTSGALTVNYTITGTATNGTDYSTIAGSATIPNGSSTVQCDRHPHR